MLCIVYVFAIDLNLTLLCVLHRAMGVDKAADQIIRGMIMGREIVSPGFLAKFYVHIVAKLLPSSLVSVGVQVPFILILTIFCVFQLLI